MSEGTEESHDNPEPERVGQELCHMSAHADRQTSASYGACKQQAAVKTRVWLRDLSPEILMAARVG